MTDLLKTEDFHDRFSKWLEMQKTAETWSYVWAECEHHTIQLCIQEILKRYQERYGVELAEHDEAANFLRSLRDTVGRRTFAL